MRNPVRGVPRVLVILIVLAHVLSLAPLAAAGEPRGIDLDLIRRGASAAEGITVFDSGSYLTGPSSADPATIVLDYVRAHHAQLGLSADVAQGLHVARVQVTPHDGVGHVVLGQTVDGIRVHAAGFVGTVDADGRLVMVSGRAAPDATSGAVRLTAGQAIRESARLAGAEAPAAPAGSSTRSAGEHRFANPYADDLPDPSPVSAELVWHMTGDGLRLAWLTDVEASSSAWFETLLDAQTGAVLDRESRYRGAGPDGDVWTAEHPDEPGATRTRVTFSGVNGTWVDATETSGNNVNAYLDRDNSNANDEYQPSNADQHFRYAFTDAWRGLPDGTDLVDLDDATITAALDADVDAIITQLFYYTNDMHDWLWGFGFDEASGNFQVTNFSGDGTGGDAVQAEAQDGINDGCQDNAMPPNPIPCINNAFFGTTNTDGSTARMQMYMWARPNRPYRDGSLDGSIIAHEYGHGVSGRLVPMGISGATNQAGSLGEGWSDALALFRWDTTIIAEYATGDSDDGLRGTPYDEHPWTYGDYSLSVNSPHRNGQIWAATMYDIRALLGITTATQLMLDGMRSTGNGPSPTFLDARDGILANDQAANGEANRCALWAAFAGRGMGTAAVSNGLHAVPTEDFSVSADCQPTADAGGPYSTPEGTDVVLDGTDSASGSHTSAGAIVTYEWDLDDDGDYDDATGANPTFDRVGQDGPYTVGLRVTDEWGVTATDEVTVTVTNVAPTVTIDPIPAIDEFGTTTISGVITDPGWQEPLEGSIDFDDGSGPHFLNGLLENVRPDATLSFSVDRQYGDDGDFVVEVCATDLVGGAPNPTPVCETAIASVSNVAPTSTIDGSGMQTYDGQQAFVVEAGEDLTVPVRGEDPGSDDLTFDWDWDDGTVDSQTSLVNPPLLDPPKSPSVQPRDVTLEQAHAYGDACLYELTVTVTDDDGGADADTAAVVITGNADVSMGTGWWLNQYRTKPPNAFTTQELECYLAIAGFFSLVFPDGMVRSDGATILHAPAKAPAEVIFDEFALAAWLNFANGAVKLDTLVDTTGDGVPDTTFGDAMLTAEMVRTNPAATTAQIKAQKDILERIVLRDS